MALAKYNVDFVGPQNIMGVSVSPSCIRYQLSNLRHVQYLDLANSELIIKNIQREPDGFDFHKLFYQDFVNSELLKCEIRINKYLFRAYTLLIRNLSSNLEVSAIFRYIKLFSLLGMEDKFVVAIETAAILMKLLRHKNIENPVLMKEILKYIFIDKRTACSLIAFRIFADHCIPTIMHYDKCSLRGPLSDIFHSHHMCPVLGSAFTHNKTLLDALINFNIQKRDFYSIFIPLNDILIGYPVYAAFEPIVENGMVTLDENKFTRRDHLLFEIVIAIAMKIGRLHNATTRAHTHKVCNSISLIHKSLPYPYISVSEMVSRLQNLNPRLPEPIITTATSTYQSLFPEIREKTCPRRLQDLCRCTIRDSVNERFTVNFGVETLKLPKKLKAFLKFEDDDSVGRQGGTDNSPRLQH